MRFSGNAITVRATDDGIAELCFDLQNESVNKFNALTLHELKEATAAIAADTSLKGVIVTSGKPVFIVGADITEFGSLFGGSEDKVQEKILEINFEIFNAFEDLPVPTVAAINGIALGGGFEMGLVCDYRVMSETAKIGLPHHWKYAFIKDLDDDSLEFIETVMLNAGYSFRTFEDENEAMTWLKGKQES